MQRGLFLAGSSCRRSLDTTCRAKYPLSIDCVHGKLIPCKSHRAGVLQWYGRVRYVGPNRLRNNNLKKKERNEVAV